jgi:hypothetical protein
LDKTYDLGTNSIKIVIVVFHVNGLRRCETTSLNCRHQQAYVHAAGDEHGKPRWNDVNRGKPKSSEKYLSQ